MKTRLSQEIINFCRFALCCGAQIVWCFIVRSELGGILSRDMFELLLRFDDQGDLENAAPESTFNGTKSVQSNLAAIDKCFESSSDDEKDPHPAKAHRTGDNDTPVELPSGAFLGTSCDCIGGCFLSCDLELQISSQFICALRELQAIGLKAGSFRCLIGAVRHGSCISHLLLSFGWLASMAEENLKDKDVKKLIDNEEKQDHQSENSSCPVLNISTKQDNGGFAAQTVADPSSHGKQATDNNEMDTSQPRDKEGFDAEEPSKSQDGSAVNVQPRGTVRDQVLEYVKALLEPLSRAQVISTEVYNNSLQKTVDKVMMSHGDETSADFLIWEGSKIRSLLDRYVEYCKAKGM